MLKTEYKYSQYCTPLSQSDCRYFFVLAIMCNIHGEIYKLERKLNENSRERDKALRSL